MLRLFHLGCMLISIFFWDVLYAVLDTWTEEVGFLGNVRFLVGWVEDGWWFGVLYEEYLVMEMLIA